ncbi:hypothetical protein WMY93_016804 [Mugilogobius chulae]|uniref:PTTG1 interacting protein n=1 Tax=Mugilogobius chulae TaxID=88201 RepID=A0AAW0NWL9_9GOBI
MMDFRTLLPALLLIFGLASELAVSQLTCESKNGTSCDECLRNVSCLWCIPSKTCITYPVRTILPPHSVCPLNDARWGLCWMNFQTLIITISVVGGVLIIGLIVCMFCCCKCENIGSQRFEAKMARQANKLKAKQEERQCQKVENHCLSGQNPYSKFA